jgi:hypothetical protein
LSIACAGRADLSIPAVVLFVLLYPHLIAGPIVRHNELVPQFAADPRREGVWRRIGIGLVIFTVGFGKKVLIADKLATVADPLFAQAATSALDFGAAWSAVLAFTFQLFLDFSAYTEMAIGSALIFGVVLPENSPPLSGNRYSRFRGAGTSRFEFSARLPVHSARRQSQWAVALSLPPWARWDCADCGTGRDGPMSPGVCGTASALSPPRLQQRSSAAVDRCGRSRRFSSWSAGSSSATALDRGSMLMSRQARAEFGGVLQESKLLVVAAPASR